MQGNHILGGKTIYIYNGDKYTFFLSLKMVAKAHVKTRMNLEV